MKNDSLRRCVIAVLSGLTGLLLPHCAAAEGEGGAGGPPAPAQPPQTVLKGAAAMGDWTTDAPGTRRLITPADLVRPLRTPSVDNAPQLVPRPRYAWPRVPPGFRIEQLADRLSNPRKIVTAPNGDLFLAESAAGRIRVLRQGPDGLVADTSIYAGELHQPFGIAFYPPGPMPQWVYVANTDTVVRFAYQNGDLQAREKPDLIVGNLPSSGRLRGGGHWTRDLVFSPDGKKMYVSVGSFSNNDDDEAQEKNRATILQYNPDGTGFTVYASGLRNAVGLAIEPVSSQLWASVNERDGLGDDLPPDFITHIQPAGFYGWPWYYIGNRSDPRHIGKHPELATQVIVPDVLLQAHSASLCMTFYTGEQFPKAYRGDAFAAEHGSWNRQRRTGYKIIRVPMNGGKATGEYEDFVTGFVTPDGDVWGRPVGVTVDRWGSLIISDDGSNSVWRVIYLGTGGTAAP